ncbi:ABC transporter permease [Paenibacillus herberti]|nr:ABC-2 family transporter protein [Paenibacillus herberti]
MIRDLKGMASMYKLLIRFSFRSSMQYRFNFWLGSTIAALIAFVEFALLAVILSRFGTIQGWSVQESAYLYSILILSKAIYRTFASDVHHLEKYLLSGDLDGLLLRPLPVLLVLMTQNVSVRFGETLLGLGMLAYSLSSLAADDQIQLWIAIPLSVLICLNGGLLLFGIGLATAATGFWLTRIDMLQNLTEDATHTAIRYPLSIYPGWLKGILTSILPVAFVNYMPALYIVRGEAGPWMLALSAAASLVVLGAGAFLWKWGISRYQSTGS